MAIDINEEMKRLDVAGTKEMLQSVGKSPVKQFLADFAERVAKEQRELDKSYISKVHGIGGINKAPLVTIINK